jgi:dienelactone hydrolase
MHASEVEVPVGALRLAGTLAAPEPGRGVVLFAHGSGSSRHSPRNRLVAARLQERGLGTLLLDLLTAREENAGAELRFDVDLLSRRLRGAADWLRERLALAPGLLGCFGASTGAAAALALAAERPALVGAVVSRGGRPDLAGCDLIERVRAPTLLIVGGDDQVVLELNQAALACFTSPAELQVVPGATHLFAEAGALELVAELAGGWFESHFRVCHDASAPQHH